jgi:threonyl-tRNA synthetase
MANITLTLPDGATREVPAGTTALDVARSISERLAKKALAAKVDGRVIDLSRPLVADAKLEIILEGTPDGLEVQRHSTAHIMASVVQKLFPGTKVTIGPTVEHGFYYDFDPPAPFAPGDLERIEAAMRDVVRANHSFVRKEVSRDDAIALFRDLGETYKVEIISAIPATDKITLYQHGDWVDLCRGPHIPATGRAGAFKLDRVAGAYWRGDERNKMLQRIYGLCFGTEKELKEHLARIEEAKKRDHRRVGKDLDLFSMDEDVGGGLVLWHPKGARIRLLVEDFWREEHLASGYEVVYSPHIAKVDLWNTSGHTSFYRENMFAGMDVEGQDYLVKPMNCPFHVKIFKSRVRSYRELPLRFAELGTVYRYERSGVLHGLLRVRGFTQDDAHLFCAPDQVKDELASTLQFCLRILKTFGFEDFQVTLSTRPKEFVGDPAVWDTAERYLKEAIEAAGLPFGVDVGGGAFYGPKIDMQIKDVLGRAWQCSTIQLDFSLPERFDLRFSSKGGALERPIMIHRALLGSIERFFGVLIEHYAGALPTWLAPIQARVVTVADRHNEWAAEVQRTLTREGFRADHDDSGEKLGAKIRTAQLEKIPYMLVVGDREVAERAVAPRARSGEDLKTMPLAEFVERLRQESRIPRGGVRGASSGASHP